LYSNYLNAPDRSAFYGGGATTSTRLKLIHNVHPILTPFKTDIKFIIYRVSKKRVIENVILFGKSAKRFFFNVKIRRYSHKLPIVVSHAFLIFLDILI